MQEDLTNRTVALSIRTATLTARTLQNAIRAVLQQMEQEKQKSTAVKQQKMQAAAHPKGKQTMKSLMKSGATLTKMELDQPNLWPFKKVADKYGIDFAVMKEKGTSPPRYLVFFKGNNLDAVSTVMEECTRAKFKMEPAFP